MKRLITLFLLSLPLSLFAQYEQQKEQLVLDNKEYNFQSKILFNFDWKFCLGNPNGASSTDFDDSHWRTLDLPHDFQFEQPWDESAGGARGFKAPCEGWYRKTFKAEEEWRGLQVLLDFGGIMYYSDVYINGVKIAASEYGYLGFETDLSKHLHYGTDNTIAVYANSGKPKASRWYTGAGIYRDVCLRLQNPTHIGRHGIFISTPSISDEKAEVQVQVDVVGFKKHKTIVWAILKDDTGKAIDSTSVEVPTLTKHQHDEIALPLMCVENPIRWELDNPYLYNIEVKLYADSMLVDKQTETFGVRTLEFSPEFGFKLNGHKVFLQGMANHHDMGALGTAAFDRAIERQFRQMKAFGFNCLRCSHNPYSESLTRIADRMGILIVDELIDKWSDDEYWGGRKPFMQLWPSLIQEWVTRDRNCPSVIMWSLGNELQTRTNWSGYDTNDWGITTYRLFDVMVKRYDHTRKTTVAQFPARAGAIREEKEFKTYFAPPELGVATEVNSFNYQWDCYPKYFEYAPNLILFQSEAVTNQLQAPFYGMDRKRTVGLAYWGAIEYWGESNKWPKKGWNYSFFSHTLRPYPQAWLIKGMFQPQEPVVRIGVMTGGESLNWNAVKIGQKTYNSYWNYPKGSKQQVVTFTNAEEVELFINGKSFGRQANDTTDVFKRGIITWQDVPYGSGGTLTAVAYTGGKEVARHGIETAGKAVSLKVEVETSDWNADGMDLQYLNIYAVDKKGYIVPDFNEALSVTVSGEASLVALDNADHFTDELFYNISSKRMREGYMQVILRSTRQPGKVTLQLQTPSIKKSIKLQTSKF